LQKLTKSVLVTYIELVKGIVQGENQEARLNAIETIFMNMHYLINIHRPQQATDTVVNLMKGELERKKRLIGEIETACEEAEAELKKLKPAE
jgi:hypothetical protein